MDAAQLRAAVQSIHTRWKHGHDGLDPECIDCAQERAELAALTAVSAALRATHAYPAGRPALVLGEDEDASPPAR